MSAKGSREERIQLYKTLADISDDDGESEMSSEYIQQVADLRDVLDLAAIVTRLCRRLPRDSEDRRKAMKFIQDRGLTSPLRGEVVR